MKTQNGSLDTPANPCITPPNEPSSDFRRSSSIYKPQITLSWEYISVFSKRQRDCCARKSDKGTINNLESNFDQTFEMQLKKKNRHQILHNGNTF